MATTTSSVKPIPNIWKFKVGSKTNVHSLAGIVLVKLSKDGKVELVAMGPEAISNAAKSTAIARKFSKEEYGFKIATYLDFVKVKAESHTDSNSEIYIDSNTNEVETADEPSNGGSSNLKTKTAMRFTLEAHELEQ